MAAQRAPVPVVAGRSSAKTPERRQRVRPASRWPILTWIVPLLALLLWGTSAAFASSDEREQKRVAGVIRATFDRSLDSLRSETQLHYLIRIWRGTGDSAVLPLLRPLVRDFMMQVRTDVDSQASLTYRLLRDSVLAEPFRGTGRKARARSSLLANRHEDIYMLNLLAAYNRMQDFGLDSTACPLISRQIERLVSAWDFRAVVLDSSLVAVYGAQIANYVHYLHRLGMADLRDSLRQVISRVFPDSTDHRLTRAQFGDKMYTLTHLILAASRYYQRPVPPEEYHWVIDYFLARKKRLLRELTTDMIAEVGLCFLLTGRSADPMLQDCRRHIMKKFDPEAGLIPSERGTTALQQAEHRNVLAILLLDWPEKLSSGPDVRAEATEFCRPDSLSK